MKQYRIGIIGSENSHARAFAKIFSQEPDFQDMIVTAVYGDEGREKSERVREHFPEAVIVDRPEDMLGSVDAVMITSRDGKYHFPYAKPFLEAGIPMFMDKPFTVDPKDARRMIALAKEKGVPMCGGSSLKRCPDVTELGKLRQSLGEKLITGYLSAPLSPNSPYSGFYFYASHLVEMCLAIFGWDPETVTAAERNGQVTAIFHYPHFDAVCAYTPGCGRYFVQMTASGDVLEAKEIDLAPAYLKEVEEFARMLRTNRMPGGYHQLMIPVFCMNAIEASYKTGRTVAISKEEAL